jgi:S-DNA-T family DNA segregation ATPase FtsK/SpoIIIE
MFDQAAVDANRDALFDDAVAVVQEAGRASTSLLQRRLRIGYTRAARLIDTLEEEGIVGPDQGGSRGREVLVAEQKIVEEASPPPIQDQEDDPPF